MIWPVQVAGRETYLWQAADRHMNALRPAYLQWRAGFERSRNGRAALGELNDLQSYNPRSFRSFRADILFACWCAQAYGAFGIVPDDARKKGWDHLQSSIPKQIESIKTLIEFFESNKLLSMLIMDRTFNEANNIKGAVRGLIDAESFVEFLKNLESSLPRYQKGGLVIGLPDRQWVACLDYGRSVRGQRRPDEEARVGLEFELALRFRLWTSEKTNRASSSVSNKSMPSTGKAHYGLIAKLLLATFNAKVVATPARIRDEQQRVGNRLYRFKHKYPDAYYIGWPVLVDQN